MNKVIRLLPAEEEAILRCYVTGSKEPISFEKLYDALEVPAADRIHSLVCRLQIAVAQIVLHKVQETLPQCALLGAAGELQLNRKTHRRHKDGRLPFHPRLVFSIEWAVSAPGISWPEQYHVTYLPAFVKYIFTASRDGDDALGCADHAIGVADKGDDVREAARRVITGYWDAQAQGWNQTRWQYWCIDGLIDQKTAVAWADEVWGDDPDQEAIERFLDSRRQRKTGSEQPDHRPRARLQPKAGAARGRAMTAASRSRPSAARPPRLSELTSADRAFVASVMANHPGLTEEEAIEHVWLAGGL